MALPLTAHDHGLLTKVDTRLDLLTDQKSNATTAMILDTLQLSVKSQSRSKKDKDYLESEAKYQALLKKQQGKAYIAEGKCWDDSDDDEEST